MKTKLFVLSGAFAIATFFSCSKTENTTAEQIVPAIDMSALDSSYRPQDDFYLFANAGWMKANPLKPSDSRYGNFDVLRDSARAHIRQIVDELSTKELKKGTDEYRIATIYRQAMDSVSRNELGANPVKAELEEIASITDKDALLEYAAKKDQEFGASVLFNTYVAADNLNSSINILHFYQTSLGLGNRDYYTEKSDKNDEVLKGYQNYLNKIMTLSGYSEEDAKKLVNNAFAIENSIAQMAYTSEMLRDDKLNYNMFSIEDFAKANTGFDWAKYMSLRGLKVEKANFSQLDFFKKFSSWFATADLSMIKDYLTVSIVSSASSVLSDEFEQANFDFFSKQLSGTKEMKPRWERAVTVVNGLMGEALGKEYVKVHFSEKSKESAKVLIDNLQKAFKQRIKALTWMSDPTKEKALEKLNNFTVKIGYPDKWKDYSSMDIDAEKSYYENMKAANRFMQADNLAELGKPVDKSKWLMNPQDVNAYYMPNTNEICFPAAILQPPFFNVNADDAVNYGAIGVVIGHELTHGFDDQGSSFDKDGNMINWWTDEDRAKFENTTSRLAEQYSKNEILPGLFANGKLTLGENVADQGGLLMAYLALQIANEGKEVAPIDGFTPAQRFYIGYARLWGQNITDSAIERLTKMDVHSLGKLRVNQALKNIDSFYEAFNIQATDSMYIAPEDRVLVW